MDGEIVDYADLNTKDGTNPLAVPGAKDAKYLLDKVVGDKLIAGTAVWANADRYLYTAYEVTLPASGVSAKLDDDKTDVDSTDKYVAEGETVVLTFTKNTGDYTVNGDLVRTTGEANDVVVEVEVSDEITVASVTNYMTADDIADEVAKYDPDAKNPTGVEIDVNGTTLNVVLDKTVTNITDRSQVKDTGLVDLATGLIAKGNSIRVTFENDDSMALTSSNINTMIASLAANVGTLPMGDRTTEVTVVVTNNASSESMEYTVIISQEA